MAQLQLRDWVWDEEVAHLSKLAARCEELAGREGLSKLDRDELLRAVRGCRELAAELDACALQDG